jgi:hypothetical protein
MRTGDSKHTIYSMRCPYFHKKNVVATSGNSFSDYCIPSSSSYCTSVAASLHGHAINCSQSAQEVLLNLLLWWKVSTLFIHLYPSDNLYSLPNFLLLLGWLGTILLFLQLVYLLNKSSRSPDTFVAIYAAL